MPKFIVVSGSIKKDKKVHGVGAELELTVEDAARLNKKSTCVELADVVNAKKKAEADAKAAVEKAEKAAAEKLKKDGVK